MRHRFLAFAAAPVAAATVLAGTGCSVGLGDVPMAIPSLQSGGYTIKAEFGNALNLPDKAKVRLSGADVGEVTEMGVHDFTANVNMRIAEDVQLPRGTRAELRTATPLGDVFVALTPPPEATQATPPLGDGDTITEQSTEAAATVEELLTTASLLVNGGAIRNLTDIANGMGRAVGDRGERINGLIDQSTQLVDALAARSDDIRTAVAETNQLATQLKDNQHVIDEFVTTAGPAAATVGDTGPRALDLVRQVDDISSQLAKFPVVQGAETGGLIQNLNEISAGMNQAATSPDASLDAMNALLPSILKLTSSTAAHGNVDLEDFSVGALPDPLHPGDPGSKVPDGYDMHTVAGTLTYTLLKLQGRVMGPGR